MIALTLQQQEGCSIVSFNDRDLIDDELLAQIADDLTEVLASVSPGTRLVLNFQGVDGMSSTMLGEVITLNKSASKKGVTLQLCALSPSVMRIITTTQLHQVLDILDEPPV